MEENVKDYSHIKGWGVDIDPKNDPTYPMKQRTNGQHQGYNWNRPTQQPIDIEVLHSNERPNVTAVFGTSVPPSKLSGRIRRFAFRYGEGSYGHWIPLMLADRVNVLEGIADDVKKGQVPNIFAERGIKAQWKYDKKSLLKKLVIGAAIATAGILLLKGKDKEDKD